MYNPEYPGAGGHRPPEPDYFEFPEDMPPIAAPDEPFPSSPSDDSFMIPAPITEEPPAANDN